MKTAMLCLGLVLSVLGPAGAGVLPEPENAAWAEWRFTRDFDADGEVLADRASDPDSLIRRNEASLAIGFDGDAVVFTQTGPDDFLRVDVDDLKENGAGDYVNRYTLIFDLKVTEAKKLPLFNTTASNHNAADLWVTAEGAVGMESYSDPGVVPLDTWVRLVVVRQREINSMWVFDIYVDGVRVLNDLGGEIVDGSTSLYTNIQQKEGQFTILADSDRALYAGCHLANFAFVSTALSARDAADLGGYDARGIFGLTDVASGPYPVNEAVDVFRDMNPSWTPTEAGETRDVYFGTNQEDVRDADRTDPRGVLLSQGQTHVTFDPGRLEFGQTYYWRIDEVTGAPAYAILKGIVWSFTVESFAYPVENVEATSNTTSSPGQGPDRLVDGSGLSNLDQHSNDTADMWAGIPNPGEPSYVRFEFDRLYKLQEMVLWNYNASYETAVGFGVKDVTVEHSQDGSNWTVLGDFELPQASGSPTYATDTTIGLEGLVARYVRLTIGSSWNAAAAKHGLSEVRFMYVPVQAGQPEPADGAAGIALTPQLRWRPGREALLHEVCLDTDPNALVMVDITGDNRYRSALLDLATTYYWKINEINYVEPVSPWEGDIWSFTTRDYIEVEGFDAYDDEVALGTTIWQTWIDGLEDFTNGGSFVGHDPSPFAEQTIVHSGLQSLPLYYENSSASAISETDRIFDPAQDWTASGVHRLSLWFHGDQGNTGQLYVKVNDVKVLYEGAGDIAGTLWQRWEIDLAAVGADLTDVTVLSIGVQGAGSGLVYIDDIRLYP